MTASPDPYAVLGVERTATVEEIHAAYRTLARSAHPDAGADDDERMAAINDAWAVLRDPTARASHDHQTELPRSAPPAEPPMGSRVQVLLRTMIVVAALLAVVIVAMVFLVGFGRVGG